MIDGQELLNELAGYTGSETVYHHGLVKSFFYTEGVRYFAQNAGRGAYWLLDILATEPKIKNAVMELGLHLVEVQANKDHTGSVTIRIDTGRDPIFVRKLDYTDCPVKPHDPHREGSEPFWKFYLVPTMVGDTEGVLCLLPREY